MRLSIRLTALLLAIVLSGSALRFFPGATAKADDTPAPSDGFFDPDFDTEEPDTTQPTAASADDTERQPAGDTTAEQASVDPIEPTAASELSKQNCILLYNAAQLFAIGSDAVVTDADVSEDAFGTGEPVYTEDGTIAVYSSDAAYYLVNDILLPRGRTFRLPHDFSGTISGTPNAEAVVYDPESDTVFIGCGDQLLTIASDERDMTPVMTGDLHPDTFGMGQFIFPDGQDGHYLTYSEDHNYALSTQFTAEKGTSPAVLMPAPALSSSQETSQSETALRGSGTRAASDHIDGRDAFGQTSVTIDGATYILIGDRQQLDAINSNATVRTKVSKPVFKATEGTVEVWRTSAHLTGDWIWLSEFDGSKDLKDGNGYGTTAAEVMASYQNLASGAEIIYPGDADLIDLGTQDFSSSPLYDVNSSGYHRVDRPAGTATNGSATREVYFTTNSSGTPDITTATLTASDPDDGTLRYEKDAKYIVFRDINMSVGYQVTTANGQGIWSPLMFTGEMYGVKASASNPTLWDSGHTTLNLDPDEKPEIYNFQVQPTRVSNNNGDASYNKLDIDVHIGVGFFGTLTGKGAGNLTISAGASDPDSFDAAGDTCVVRNLRLRDGAVNNPLTAAEQDQTLVNALVDGLGNILGFALTELLRALTGKTDIGVDALSNALNSRAADPTNLATGAFAGRIIGNVRVLDCEVLRVPVTTVLTDLEDPNSTLLGNNNPKIVGKGGFVGHAEGVTSYSVLTKALGQLATALASVLNLIPGLGLGDLITLLLDKLLPVGQLIPTKYTSPEITRCDVNDGTLSTEDGKYGVGGFAGSLAGTVVTDCAVKNSAMTVNADHFGGGFAGVVRDGVIKGLLSGLGIDVISLLHPQTELIRCSIENCTMEVEGNTFLGGFTGILANSYGINDTIDGFSTLTVTGTGDYVGGFTGQATLGSLFDLANYVEDSDSLLSVVKQALTSLIGTDQGQSLLDLSGVASAAILGLQNDAPTTVTSTGGNFVGGMVGKAEGTIIARSDETHLRKLSKYKRQNTSNQYVNDLPTGITARDNHVTQLVSVSAGKDYAGGIAGHISTANVGGLLGSTLGLAEFVGFEVSRTYINGIDDTTGYTVTTGTNVGVNAPENGDYAGGAFGWAVGGDVVDVGLTQLGRVQGNNHIGGFVGTTGPGNLADNEGLDLSLLGVSLLSANNVLSLISAQRTTYLRANVTGITAGYTVEETGSIQNNATDIAYTAGGYAGDANSVRFVDCHANNLKSVTANLHDGNAGGFVARSAAGDIADAADHMDTNTLANLLSINQLLDAIPLLVPSYDGCDVNYVSGGYVTGDTAGGFAGDFMSGKVNTYTMETTEISGTTYTGVNPIDNPNTTYVYSVGNSTEPWSVNNIAFVYGGNYGGGWGGHVYPGALASAGGGLNVLGVADTSAISADDLLGVADVYIPIIKYAGVHATNGFVVYAAHDESNGTNPATAGYAGGFIGYGQSVQVSYCDVNMLAHREVVDPALEAPNGRPSEPDAFTADDDAAYARIDLAPDVLESQDGGNYITYDLSAPYTIPYSVTGAVYAGGYIGHMDIGSAASVGDKLSLLGSSLDLTNILGVLSVVVSTIEHSDVYGGPGGFDVLASTHVNLGDGDFDEHGVSYAGGFAGKISGGHIQDSNCDNFSYIIGEVAAGGYVGEMIAGEVAKVLPQSDISLIDTNTSGLASLAEDFVPSIRNSETTCIPCGGAVRAESFSDRTYTRGMAGGYVGHCVGGQIWGNSNDAWKSENDGYNALTGTYTDNLTIGHYTGEQRICTAHRIRSVYGAEYAGGYAGFIEAGSTADVGSLSVLGGLLRVDNLLGTLNATYATIKRAGVTGPLKGVDKATWKKWQQYIGSKGQFSSELQNLTEADVDAMTEAEFAELISQYVYGMHVVAGRHRFNTRSNTFLSGCAGGFAGPMHSGVIEHAFTYDTKLVLGMRAAGGFVGEMQTGDLAKAGGISLLGLNLDLGALAPDLGSVLVPAVRDCEGRGYAMGLQVGATGAIGNETDAATTAATNDPAYGVPSEVGVGCAGGFVGAAYGGQLGGKIDGQMAPTAVRNLKRVKGVYSVGGYAGLANAAAVVSADTENASSGILQQLLNAVVSSKGGLLDALHATVCTINAAVVESVKDGDGNFDAYGFVVDGEYQENGTTKYAPYAGGFAGMMQATLVNTTEGSVTGSGSAEVYTPDTEEGTSTVTVRYLRGVNGGHYVGGFVGLGSVGSVAQIGGSSTSILNLLNLGNVGLLDVFRTYIYRATVHGVEEGICIYAHDWQRPGGNLNGTSATGAAGGFAGGLMSGTIEDCSIDRLNYVEAPNFAAGFVGHSGTKSVLNLTGAEVVESGSVLNQLLTALGLDLSASLELMNIIGSTFQRDTVEGFGSDNDGFFVKATNTLTPQNLGVEARFVMGACAAGFIGYADIAQIEDSCAATKIRKISSPQIAGGFVGRSSVSYLADAQVSSDLVGALTFVVRLLLAALGIGALEDVNLVNLYGYILGIQVLSGGNVAKLNLFGLVISVSVVSTDPVTGNPTAVTVTLGSSTITLPVGTDGQVDTSNLSVTLIELNRTAIRDALAKGIADGYDVFGGGANDGRTGTDTLGYAGGFIGLNDHGFVSHSTAELLDTVIGTADKTGPFVGGTLYNAQAQGPDRLEGTSNHYYIYREDGANYSAAQTAGGTVIAAAETDTTSVHGKTFNRYDVTHRAVVSTLSDLSGAQETGAGEPRSLDAYHSTAKYVGMGETILADNSPGNTPMPGERKDPCDFGAPNITLQKVWDDDNDAEQVRPNTITVTVAVVDYGTTPPPQMIVAGRPTGTVVWQQIYTLTLADNGDTFSDTWSKTVKPDLTGCREDGHYYVYYVYEAPVPTYYNVSYVVDQDTASVKMTNAFWKLPDTGGVGTTVFTIVGIALLIAGALLAAAFWISRKEGGPFARFVRR